jgi:phospholipid/cholesterol/gamma-HCH transport system substrate-binding protein
MSKEIKVGGTLLISLVILIGGIMWGKGFRLNAKRYVVTVMFKNTGGLENGANVLANGVLKGSVKKIEFNDGFVRVTASLDEDVIIYSDYLATIESPTVMAGQALSIYTGTEQPRADVNQPLTGSDPQGMAAIMSKIQAFGGRIETTLNHLDSVLVDAHKVLGDTTNQANMNKLMTNAAGIAENSNQMLAENRKMLEASLADLHATMLAARELTEKLNGRSDSTLAGVDSALSAMTGAANGVRDLIAKVNSGEGTMGKLFTDDALYNTLHKTLIEVDSLSQELRTNGMRQRIVLF